MAFVLFYLIGWGFGILPQPLVDGVTWLANNFTTIAVMFCFAIGAIVTIKVLSLIGKRGCNNY